MLNITSSEKCLELCHPKLKLMLLQVIFIFLKSLENSENSFAYKWEDIGMAWWVEIITKLPDCIYYFGPFSSHREAQISQLGYIEDLERERPKLIAIEIKQCQPQELTVFVDDLREKLDNSISQSISA